MGEIGEVAQIIRLVFDGCEFIFKAGGTAISVIKKIVMVLYNVLNREKLQGKTSMKKLLQRGSNLQVFKFDEKQMDQVLAMAKKYGILFSVLPEINKADGFREIVFHNEDLPRVNAMIEHLKEGQIETMTDYVNNADPKDFKEAVGDVEKAVPEMTEIKDRDLAGRLKVIDASHNPSMQLITIGKGDVISEDEKNLFIKIPDGSGYLSVPREDAMQMKSGKWVTSLEKEKSYEIKDSDGRKKSSAKGEELHKKYESADTRVSLAERERELQRMEQARKAELKKAEEKKQAAERKKVKKAVKKGGKVR